MSPRLDGRLAAAAVSLDDCSIPAAETWRRVCIAAEELRLPRPAYDTVRCIVRRNRHDREEIRRLLEPVIADALRGRLSAWDLDRIIEASIIARAGHESADH